MPDQILMLAAKLEKLRRTDREYRAFGAGDPDWGHFYLLAPKLDELRLAAFEQRCDISLPADYRHFLQHIGNGGAGPYYGLMALEKAEQGCAPETPFPFPNEPIQLEERWQQQWNDAAPGILYLCDQGCGYYSFLVVKGKNCGTVWNDFIAADLTLHPTGQTFAQWYESWMDRVLAQLTNFPLGSQLTPGMSRQQVMTCIGDRPFEAWQRDGMAGYGLLFENVPFDIRFSDDHVVQSVLDLPIL